jgi:hypothetical protein
MTRAREPVRRRGYRDGDWAIVGGVRGAEGEREEKKNSEGTNSQSEVGFS